MLLEEGCTGVMELVIWSRVGDQLSWAPSSSILELPLALSSELSVPIQQSTTITPESTVSLEDEVIPRKKRVEDVMTFSVGSTGMTVLITVIPAEDIVHTRIRHAPMQPLASILAAILLVYSSIPSASSSRMMSPSPSTFG